MPPDLVYFILAQIATAAGVYGAIRADLREALTRVGMAEKRLDRLEAAK